MKRYSQLIRTILEFSEGKGSSDLIPPPEICGYTPEQIHYHVGLCEEAGYLHVESISGAEEPYRRYAISSLTWNGHEALDRLRNK